MAGRLRALAARSSQTLSAWLGRGRPEAGLTAEERFLFDLEGYLILRHVLTPPEVATLNAIAAQRAPATPDSPPARRVFGAATWGAPFQALIDHPRIVPYLVDLVGPKFRLDHDFCIFMTKGGRDHPLHGGETSGNPDHWYRYRDGVMRNGLTVVAFLLSDVNVRDGGFCCIPGSHKSNFVTSVPDDVRHYQRLPHYVVQPSAAAGDVIIFTEALIHGTVPWRADHERRALLYKYGPGHSAWMSGSYDLSAFRDLTAQQRRILAPPFVGGRPDSLGRE
jgi:hypothetical protein